MRYRLRTLLILLAILTPILAVVAPPLARRFVTKPQLVRAVSHSRPEFKSYYFKYAHTSIAHQVTSTLLGNQPNVRLSPDLGNRALHVLAPREGHAAVMVILKALDQPSSPSTPAEVAQFMSKLPAEWFQLPLVELENAEQLQ